MTTANIAWIDDEDIAVGALFAPPRLMDTSHLTAPIQQAWSSISDGGKAVLGRVVERVKDLGSHARMATVSLARAKMNQAWQVDGFRTLRTSDEILAAPPTMQPYVMAHPRLRGAQLRGGIAGYADMEDPAPSDIGRADYRYRRATNGLVIQNDQGELSYVNHYEELLSADDALDIVQKSCIQETWRAIDGLLDGSDLDPTSEYGELLG